MPTFRHTGAFVFRSSLTSLVRTRLNHVEGFCEVIQNENVKKKAIFADLISNKESEQGSPINQDLHKDV